MTTHTPPGLGTSTDPADTGLKEPEIALVIWMAISLLKRLFDGES
jgi:hypothetical protein